MYFLIFLVTLILYIINKDMSFLYVSGIFAIADGLVTIASRFKKEKENEKNI